MCKAAPENDRRTVTILAVDDDPAVVRLMQAVLERSGFDVVGARGGEEALEEFRRRKGQVDALVSDVFMPAMNGPTLAREITKEKPGLPVLFVSGCLADRDEWSEVEHSARNYLAKPFSPAHLVKSVKRLLAS